MATRKAGKTKQAQHQHLLRQRSLSKRVLLPLQLFDLIANAVTLF
jgi:hypothetical protein